MESIRKYDDEPSNQANNMSGWNGNVRDDSSEADDERRLEAERLRLLEVERLAQLERDRLAKLEAERQAKLEADRVERERLIAQALEREKLAKQEQQRREQEKLNLKLNKEKELVLALKEEKAALQYWGDYGSKNPNKDTGHPPGYLNLPQHLIPRWNAAEWNKVVSAQNKVERLKKELEQLK